MVLNSYVPAKVKLWEYTGDSDLRVFLAYCSDLQEAKGISEYRMLLDAGISRTFASNCRRLLSGKSQFKKNIPLHFVFHLARVHNYPFDMSKYWHLIQGTNEGLNIPQEPKKG